jgi:hypothetical protein
MDFRFGIVSEGVTDQAVIKAILIGFCENKDLLVTQLQPTEEEKQKANWDQVIKYIGTEDFRQAVNDLDFVVIQIDSDIFGSDQVDENHRLELSQKSTEESVEAIKELLIRDIGEAFYSIASSRIIFAIAVNEIECWFLPIYFSNSKAKAGKTTGCITTLNEGLQKAKAGLFIDKKNLEHYRTISKPFMKKANLSSYQQANPSLGVFISELEEKTSS